MYTPWGISDYSEQKARGIVFYGTPSHGGYCLSPTRLAQMPAAWVRSEDNKRGWYEEDCDWWFIALCWPELFPADHVAWAREMVERHYPGTLAAGLAEIEAAGSI